MKSQPGPPATLGSTAAAGARVIVWCRGCGWQVEPDPAEMAERYGAAPAKAWVDIGTWELGQVANELELALEKVYERVASNRRGSAMAKEPPPDEKGDKIPTKGLPVKPPDRNPR